MDLHTTFKRMYKYLISKSWISWPIELNMEKRIIQRSARLNNGKAQNRKKDISPLESNLLIYFFGSKSWNRLLYIGHNFTNPGLQSIKVSRLDQRPSPRCNEISQKMFDSGLMVPE